MKKNKTKISISIDKELEYNMDIDNTNRSKLINFLLKKYLLNTKFDKNKFKRK